MNLDDDSKWGGWSFDNVWGTESPSYDSNNDKIDPRFCVDHVPVETGMRRSWCKRCDTNLEFLHWTWVPRPSNKVRPFDGNY
jgi:hypothetical protein